MNKTNIRFVCAPQGDMMSLTYSLRRVASRPGGSFSSSISFYSSLISSLRDGRVFVYNRRHLLHIPSKLDKGKWSSGVRGAISSFSVRSRSRMMKKIAQIKKHHLPLFVTLTYPNEFPEDYEVYKYHVHKFFIYLARKFPAFGAVWKLEYQKRGAAHFHLLLWGCDLDVCRDFIPGLWYRIVGSGDYDHYLFHHGDLSGSQNCVQAVRSWNGVRSYASKYLSKIDDTVDKTGRFWGLRGSHREVCGYKKNEDGTDNYDKPIYTTVSNIPFSPLMSFTIDMKSALDFKRSIRRALNFKSKRLGFWSFGYSPDWMIYVDYLVDLESKNSLPGMPEPPPMRYSMLTRVYDDVSIF